MINIELFKISIYVSCRSPGEIKHNLKLDHDFYNLTMTYRLDSDIEWKYRLIIDLMQNSIFAPAVHPQWRQTDNDFFGNCYYYFKR
jgi:alpha-1,3-fucosyltransferase